MKVLSVSDMINFNPRSRDGSDTFPENAVLMIDISIHAPAKGATFPDGLAFLTLTFQSTLPRRERHQHDHLEQRRRRFQSTLPRRERPAGFRLLTSFIIFQSTLPRRERRSRTKNRHFFRYFNPRSREGSDYACKKAEKISGISIHAPAKGATPEKWPKWRSWKFQSTLPRRERRYAFPYLAFRLMISIHAPAKGATRSKSEICVAVEFQSTLPRGERRRPILGKGNRPFISIHAPARGATMIYDYSRSNPWISIHAPARGATRIPLWKCLLYRISIHAPARGATKPASKEKLFF